MSTYVQPCNPTAKAVHPLPPFLNLSSPRQPFTCHRFTPQNRPYPITWLFLPMSPCHLYRPLYACRS